MGIGHKERCYDIVFLEAAARQPFAAAFLCAEFSQGRALDIATCGDGHDHVFAFDQVFVIHVARPIDNLGAARHGEGRFHLGQFFRDDRHDPITAGEDGKIFFDLTCEFLQLIRHFLDANLGQALQA